MENTHKKNKGVSVIICCYNSAERLPETLRHISKQKYLDNTSWELIIVNNNSTDNTAEVAERCWLEYGSTTVLKLINEPSPGLTNARIAGIKNSSYEYIIFCDDDNWLGPSYLYNVIKLLNNRSNIGIVGPSKMEAVYESPKPKWLEGHEHLLCVYDKKQDEIIVSENETTDLLATAGMGVRKKILIQYLSELKKNQQRLLLGRSPSKMLSGEDDDICLIALKLGYNLLFTNKLNLKHFIPAFKSKKQYILRLYEGMAYSN
ncbi:MAG: glycosyltransferase family 2 protein, partial [Flavisolibacter sp.]|nr:glycosyltransferase family 2 protein [Flavisolibacter sp.]